MNGIKRLILGENAEIILINQLVECRVTSNISANNLSINLFNPTECAAIKDAKQYSPVKEIFLGRIVSYKAAFCNGAIRAE